MNALPLATLIGGLVGYCLAKHLCQHEGEQRFNELMDGLPWFAIDGIDDWINDHPILTASYPE